ncbi:AAA family ATPase [Actinoplanes sp. NPDC049599]|uniref:AAA family ATPase n=1 Tax=Actinoplanes sp. NPDC049599 TaxID=3363903 RepID=UPI0037AA4C15
MSPATGFCLLSRRSGVHMRRYILTGAPGSGKTAVLRQLEIDGYAVVEEAATDVIALRQALGTQEPWREPAFLDDIADLQRRRQLSADTVARPVTFFDRSPVCTLALSRHLGVPAATGLRTELDRIRVARVYEPSVFFVRHQGSVRPTAARRISFEESLVFEKTHEAAYRELGFTLVEVPAAPLPVRAALIRQAVDAR